jgi:hypothetical protein
VAPNKVFLVAAVGLAIGLCHWLDPYVSGVGQGCWYGPLVGVIGRLMFGANKNHNTPRKLKVSFPLDSDEVQMSQRGLSYFLALAIIESSTYILLRLSCCMLFHSICIAV